MTTYELNAGPLRASSERGRRGGRVWIRVPILVVCQVVGMAAIAASYNRAFGKESA